MSKLQCIGALTISVLAAMMLLVTVNADPVTKMPGFNGTIPAKIDTGYITVDESKGRNLFYYFTESQRNPSTDPFVLWLTGGPGCSSLGAMFAENGMFNMDFNTGSVELNPYSWNTIANVVYLESPAFVGFSYSKDPSDLITGDEKTANDTYTFLQGFLNKFPQFRKNDFYVTGESYGGHYVPEIVYKVVTENLKAPAEQKINIKGHMVGNPWTDPSVEAFGVTDNWWQRGIISEKVYNAINTHCTYRDITHWIINNVSAPALFFSPTMNTATQQRQPTGNPCYDALMEGSMVQFGGVDILGVYLDVCRPGTKGNIPDQPNYCATQQLKAYLNRPDVQAALHVRNAPVQWDGCSSTVQYNQADTQSSVLWIYQYLIQQTNMRILVYSGDNDAIVPYTGTRKWLKVLNRPIVNDVHEWYVNTNGDQVGGWATTYDRLTFTTVRGAGHMVPFMQPQRALWLFNAFINKIDI